MFFILKFLSDFCKTLWSLWKPKYITSFTFINYIYNSVNNSYWVNLYMNCFVWNHGALLFSHNTQLTRITCFYLFIFFALLKDWHIRFFPILLKFPQYLLEVNIKDSKESLHCCNWNTSLLNGESWLRVCKNISETGVFTSPYASLPIYLPSMNFVYHFIAQSPKVWYSSRLRLRSVFSIWIPVALSALLHSQPFFLLPKIA